jgi:hypothetical protein
MLGPTSTVFSKNHVVTEKNLFEILFLSSLANKERAELSDKLVFEFSDRETTALYLIDFYDNIS